MQTVICDTGPLVALQLIGLLDVVPRLFRPVIPCQVYREWLDGDPERLLPEAFTVGDFGSADPLLTAMLDLGEAAVIHSALSLPGAIVLIDEKRGRSLARRIYGLRTIGTARLLVEAKRAGHIEEITSKFEMLRECSYWIADDIVTWACAEVGESDTAAT